MPAVPPEALVKAILDAIVESGGSGTLVSPLREQPRKFAIFGPRGSDLLKVYAWTLTPGGRPSLPDEYRIQMTGVKPPLQSGAILIGYEPDLGLFAGFDLQRHRTFTTGSSSVQIDRAVLQQADRDGLSFHRKSNDEIATGIRPDLFIAYALNASVLHHLGKDSRSIKLLQQAVQQGSIMPEAQTLSGPRQRIVIEVNRLSRDAAFRRRVLFAYGNRCAVTGVQLRLVDAAHILPVGVPESSDVVQNGIALSPTYHRAFDAGLIYLDEQYQMRLNEHEARLLHMRLNEHEARLLHSLKLGLGIEAFCAPLGSIFLPPDPAQRPSLRLIQLANLHRQVR